MDAVTAQRCVPPTDVEVRGTSRDTVVLLLPLTEAARAWAEKNVTDDRITLGVAIAVEHRYLPPILDCIALDGLKVRYCV